MNGINYSGWRVHTIHMNGMQVETKHPYKPQFFHAVQLKCNFTSAWIEAYAHAWQNNM